MLRHRFNKPQAQFVHQPLNTNPDLPMRIEKVLKETLDEKSKNLVLSFQTYCRSKNGLTPRQYACFEKIESHFSPQAKELAVEWEKRYNQEAREIMKICAEYYVKTGQYFVQLCRRILEDSTAVPTEREFNKITKNKYAEKVILATLETPKFKKNDLVMINKSATGQSVKYIGKMAFVVQPNSGPVTSAYKGAKKYKVLPFGAQHMIEVEERFLKKSKRDKNESQHNVQSELG